MACVNNIKKHSFGYYYPLNLVHNNQFDVYFDNVKKTI